MNLNLKSYSDSGHGWLAVKRSVLHDLGILNIISRYSYQRGKTVYLEEDMDVSTFFHACRLKGYTWSEIKQNYSDGNSPIRSYDSFRMLEDDNCATVDYDMRTSIAVNLLLLELHIEQYHTTTEKVV